MKNKIDRPFYKTKWFKLFLSTAFFGWLFSIVYNPHQVNKTELIELKVTVNEKWESGSVRDPIKLYFKTNEYSNRFGIYVGGTFGKWTEVTNALENNSCLTIKIYKNEKKDLNKSNEVIPIYYLKSDNLGLVFDENNFNQGEKNSDKRIVIFLLILFIISLWNILSD